MLERARRHWLWPLSVAVVGFGAFTGLSVLTRAVPASGGNGARAHTPDFTFWVGLVAGRLRYPRPAGDERAGRGDPRRQVIPVVR
ncbi:hypothetical protein ALI22I_43735 [Saccharothrix sp. ALI-22-I]|nr:hypothetical protein ALI22I_43735 [Saccharothrix sp. ALI-22-I]